MNAPVSNDLAAAPWLARKDWAAGEIRSADRTSAVLLWIVGLIFCAAAIPLVLYALPPELHKGHKAILLVLIFPAVGVLLLISAGYATLRRLKYGSVIFKMAPVPGVIDGSLSGAIQIPGRFDPAAGIHVHLCCVHRTTSGTGDSRHTWEKILWEDEKILGNDLPRTGPDQFEVPVFFKIPGDAKATEGSNRDDAILWRLIATSRQPGVDFRAVFEVPVFQTEKSGQESALAADTTVAYQLPFDPLRDAAALGIKVVDRAEGGREFILPATRNFSVKFGVTCFWLILTGACCFLACVRPDGFLFLFMLIFYLVFGLFELVFTLICLDLWLRSSRVIATADALTVRTRWLFLTRNRTIPAAEVSEIKIDNTMSAGETLYYDVQILTSGAKKITAASAIRSKREAEWLADQLGGALKTRAS